MVEIGTESDEPCPCPSVLELAVAMGDLVRLSSDSWGRPFVAVAFELGAGAALALAASEPRFRTDWINVHAAAVGKLERSIAVAMSTRLLSAEAVVRDVFVAMARCGWSRANLDYFVSSSADQWPAPKTIANGRALAELDELELATWRTWADAYTSCHSGQVSPQAG